jgi:hypothetical protein
MIQVCAARRADAATPSSDDVMSPDAIVAALDVDNDGAYNGRSSGENLSNCFHRGDTLWRLHCEANTHPLHAYGNGLGNVRFNYHAQDELTNVTGRRCCCR